MIEHAETDTAEQFQSDVKKSDSINNEVFLTCDVQDCTRSGTFVSVIPATGISCGRVLCKRHKKEFLRVSS